MEFEIIRDIVSKVMKVDPRELAADTTFVDDLGADSIDICRILMGIEEEFNVKLSNDYIYRINTIDDAVSLVTKIKKA